MTNKYIRKTAKNFLKEINSRTDFVSVEEYLKKLGYKVIFFNTPNGDIELERFNLKEKAKYTNSFTYTGSAKIVFINGNTSPEDKKYLLYHEAGHILLGHLDYPRMSAKSNCLMEFEADTFAHLIVNPPKTNKAVILMTVLMILATSISFYAGKHFSTSSTSNTSPVINQTLQDSQKTYEINTELVCITRTGRKYHKEDCRYVKNGYIKISLSDAKEMYSPCSVCKP